MWVIKSNAGEYVGRDLKATLLLEKAMRWHNSHEANEARLLLESCWEEPLQLQKIELREV